MYVYIYIYIICIYIYIYIYKVAVFHKSYHSNNILWAWLHMVKLQNAKFPMKMDLLFFQYLLCSHLLLIFFILWHSIML